MDVIDAAIRRQNVPEYLGKMLRSYMSRREVLVPDSDHFEADGELMVPQGIRSGPGLMERVL